MTPEEKAAKATADKAAADQKTADKAAAAAKIVADKETAAAAQAVRDAEEVTDGVKVEFLRSHPAFGYFAGEKGTITKADFEKYSKDGEFFKKL